MHCVILRSVPLAKNAGTSVEKIERLYAKHLPMATEL